MFGFCFIVVVLFYFDFDFFGQGPKEINEGRIQGDIGARVSKTEMSQCKGSEAGLCLCYLQSGTEVSPVNRASDGGKQRGAC